MKATISLLRSAGKLLKRTNCINLKSADKTSVMVKVEEFYKWFVSKRRGIDYIHHYMAADPLLPWLLFSEAPKGRAERDEVTTRSRGGDVFFFFIEEMKGYDDA